MHMTMLSLSTLVSPSQVRACVRMTRSFPAYYSVWHMSPSVVAVASDKSAPGPGNSYVVHFRLR